MDDPAFLVLVLIIVIGLLFDFVNGFHDTANAIATSVATRVLSPGQAVSMAAVLNVVGALTGTAVATTVGRGIVPPEVATQQLVIAALISATAWNLLTWRLAIPSSSSHALIFSIVGAGVAAGGVEAIQIDGLSKTFQGLAFSPYPRLPRRPAPDHGLTLDVCTLAAAQGQPSLWPVAVDLRRLHGL